MIRYLKRGASEAEKSEADRQTRHTVEAILDDIADRGDVAVRELSAKFDKWEPVSFRLSESEINDLIATLPAQVIEEPDIDVKWDVPDAAELTEVERALAELSMDHGADGSVPEAHELSARLAAGSSPVALEGAPLVQPDRKRPLPRPSMKQQFAAELDGENELDVPTFIRRHGANT